MSMDGCDSAAREGFESSEGCGSGRDRRQLRSMRQGLRWEEMLKPSNGGPGESPGRAEAIVRARVRSAEKALQGKGRKR